MEFKPKAFKDILDKSEVADGDIIRCIRGKITGLYKANKGEGQSGPYEYQNGEMTDEAGTKIKVSFSNNTQPESAKGKTVTITSSKSEQHGWQGIKVVDSEYESKKTKETVKERVLRITATAKIEFDGGAPAEGPKDRATTSGGTSGPTRPSGVHPLIILKDIIALHAKVVDLVTENYGEAMKPEYIATVFIEACRQGCQHDAAKELSKPIQKTYPPAPKDPAKWRECIVPKGANEGKTLEEVSDEDLMKLHEYYDNHDTPKVANGAFAECVYQAARDRKLQGAKPQAPEQTDDEPAEDDIPF